MSHRVVAMLEGRPVGRYHGPLATHVAVVILASGRIQCRGWGLRTDAEAALERVRRHEAGLRYAAVHEVEEDRDSTVPLKRRRASRAPSPRHQSER